MEAGANVQINPWEEKSPNIAELCCKAYFLLGPQDKELDFFFLVKVQFYSEK